MDNNRGRVTIPTDLDVIKETLDIMKEWGADAIRDCDGTEFPQELKNTGAKIYATYLYDKKRQCMGEGASGRNPADVYYDFFPYSCCGKTGDPSDGSSVSGYACGEYTG